jgi:hypothetical protein
MSSCRSAAYKQTSPGRWWRTHCLDRTEGQTRSSSLGLIDAVVEGDQVTSADSVLGCLPGNRVRRARGDEPAHLLWLGPGPVTLVLYLFGILSSFIFTWFHGAPGRQYAPRVEVVLQTVLDVVAVITGVYVYRTQAAALDFAGEMGISPTSIAVLYFEDLSPDGDLAYVADGLTEALIEQLSEVRSLDVVSRNGVLPYRQGNLRSADGAASVEGAGTGTVF